MSLLMQALSTMDAIALFFTIMMMMMVATIKLAVATPFTDNYNVIWSPEHVFPSQNGSTIDLSLDQHTGAGFESKLNYSSGFFHMNVKLPTLDDYGVMPTFYLMEKAPSNVHDEIDFEFFGSDTLPLILSTNVFTKGIGGREQKIKLWFDPRADYHSYSILWNAHQIVFYVDGTPIRVFKNSTDLGAGYPTDPMKISATIWYAEWALSGHHTNWSRGPFNASYNSFNIEACSDPTRCYSSEFWWNKEQYWQLNSTEEIAYENVRKNYLFYDYCADKPRYPVPPPECPKV